MKIQHFQQQRYWAIPDDFSDALAVRYIHTDEYAMLLLVECFETMCAKWPKLDSRTSFVDDDPFVNFDMACIASAVCSLSKL